MSDQRDLAVALRDPLPYMERVRNPQDAPAPLVNEEGYDMTHLMAAEIGEDGNWYVFPTIQEVDGKLQQMPVRDAMRRAQQMGNTLNFEQDKDAALKFAEGGYKTEEFKNYRP